MIKNVKIWNKNMYMKKIDYLFIFWYKDKNLINFINFYLIWVCINDWFMNFFIYWIIDILKDWLIEFCFVIEIFVINVGVCFVKGKVIYCLVFFNELGEMKLELI